ncbi:class I SAM-dependent methyltransferase [Hydrogenobacter sp. T-2]|uniref:class I SAM-dependent methyltransferase n=1 Tax=Pampinifervens diazotrophicum TaxID=1632018 RepID=UPI002B263FED|nr:class I SAM-dependent methyltransferase [Hydrogenobacter sp. T-2]WPM31880.1 class I SAM-dependent methyltransferase [Hydrogenobacter sp. T-2]
MALQDKERWDFKYLQGWQSTLHKALVEFFTYAPVGRALEIACGTGENAIFLAEQGFTVDAIDISIVALKKARRQAYERNLRVNFICADLDYFILKENTYTLVVNFYYLNRRLIPQIKKALKPNGLIIFETYNEKHSLIKRDFNPDYLLKEGELFRLFEDFRVVFYKEELNISTLVAFK